VYQQVTDDVPVVTPNLLVTVKFCAGVTVTAPDAVNDATCVPVTVPDVPLIR